MEVVSDGSIEWYGVLLGRGVGSGGRKGSGGEGHTAYCFDEAGEHGGGCLVFLWVWSRRRWEEDGRDTFYAQVW